MEGTERAAVRGKTGRRDHQGGSGKRQGRTVASQRARNKDEATSRADGTTEVHDVHRAVQVLAIMEGMQAGQAEKRRMEWCRIRYAHVEGTGIRKGTQQRCRVVENRDATRNNENQWRILHKNKQRPLVCWIETTNWNPVDGWMQVKLVSGWTIKEPTVLVGQVPWINLCPLNPSVALAIPMKLQREDGTQHDLHSCLLHIQLVVVRNPPAPCHQTCGLGWNESLNGRDSHDGEEYFDAEEPKSPRKTSDKRTKEGFLVLLLNWALDLLLQVWAVVSTKTSWAIAGPTKNTCLLDAERDRNKANIRESRGKRNDAGPREIQPFLSSGRGTVPTTSRDTASETDRQTGRRPHGWAQNLPQAAHQEVDAALSLSQRALGRSHQWDGQFCIGETLVTYGKGLTASDGSGHSLLHGRGTLEIPHCTPEEVAGVIVDLNCQLLLKAFADRKKTKGVLHKYNEHCHFCHLHIKPPWPVQQRAISFLLARTKQPGGSYLVVGRSVDPQDIGLKVDHGEAPPAVLEYGCYRIEPSPTGTVVSLILRVNAKMNLPHFALVLLLRDLMGSLNRLKAELANSRLQGG